MLLKEALDDYILHMTSTELKSDYTIKSYKGDLNAYISFLQKNSIDDVLDIKYDLIMAYIKQIKPLYASNTLSRKAIAIRSFHKYLSFKYGYPNPADNLEVVKGKTKLPIYCTIDEIDKIMSYFTNDPKDILNHAILELIYACGLRVSEACNLTLNNISLENRIVNIWGKGDKQRVIPIPDNSLGILKEYANVVRTIYNKNICNNFFIKPNGKPISSNYVEIMLHKVCKEIGLDNQITPHKLRHSYATHLLDNGTDIRYIQELLGHSVVSTTQIYTHVESNKLVNDYRNFHPMQKKGSK